MRGRICKTSIRSSALVLVVRAVLVEISTTRVQLCRLQDGRCALQHAIEAQQWHTVRLIHEFLDTGEDSDVQNMCDMDMWMGDF
jgi:hypothetical protein